jgi:hypothetical protein
MLADKVKRSDREIARRQQPTEILSAGAQDDGCEAA